MSETITREALAERRTATEGKLAEFHVTRGRALLDGQTVDGGDLAALENEIGAILDAESEMVKRERAQAAEVLREHRARLRARIDGEKASRLANVARAEAALRTFKAELSKALENSGGIRAAYRDLNEPPPPALDAFEEARRFSNRVSIVFKDIFHPSRFGDLQLSFGPWPADGDWAEAEAKLMNGDAK